MQVWKWCLNCISSRNPYPNSKNISTKVKPCIIVFLWIKVAEKRINLQEMHFCVQVQNCRFYQIWIDVDLGTRKVFSPWCDQPEGSWRRDTCWWEAFFSPEKDYVVKFITYQSQAPRTRWCHVTVATLIKFLTCKQDTS